jgi:tetratricopeptide (TPR) repeat protein
MTPAEFDAAFLEECRRTVAGWSLRPRWRKERLAEFRARSEKDPKDLDAHLDLAEACLQSGNSLDAGTALARARAVAPDDPRLTELRGWLALRDLKNADRGFELLREARAKGRDHFDLRMALAERAEADGRPEEAVEHYRRAKVQFPRADGPAEPRRELARLYNALGKKDAARAEIEESVAMGETDFEGRLLLAGLYEGEGDLARAVEMLRGVIDIVPVPAPLPRQRETFAAAEVHARLGRLLAGTKRHGEAADAFRVAVAVGRTWDPREQPATLARWLVEFARAARAAGRAKEAREALEDALRTDPANPDAAELLRSSGDG